MKKNCRVCNEEFETKYKTKECSKKCKQIYKENKRFEHLEKLQKKKLKESFVKFPDGADYGECKICGLRSRQISDAHLKIHNITTFEYKKKYGDTLRSNEYRKFYSERYKGENNPAFNHKGKLSPISKNFHKYKDLTNKEKELKICSVLKNIKNTKKEHPENVNTRIEYFLNKGLNKKEARDALIKRQKCFSLDICIEKYGAKEGRIVWQERQDRWQTTLNNKPQKEINDINLRKTSGGWGLTKFKNFPELKNKDCILYYINFYNKYIKFWKIGITTRLLNKRINELNKNSKLKYKILMEEKDTFFNCFIKEQKILKQLINKRIKINYNGFKSTECFTEDILNEIT